MRECTTKRASERALNCLIHSAIIINSARRRKQILISVLLTRGGMTPSTTSLSTCMSSDLRRRTLFTPEDTETALAVGILDSYFLFRRFSCSSCLRLGPRDHGVIVVDTCNQAGPP